MDLSKRAQRRIYWQYRNAEKLRAWVNTLPALAQTELEDPAQTLVEFLDIDQRKGEQLDIIGRIVGLDRPPITSTAEQAFTAFGFEEDAPQMGSTGAQMGNAEQVISEEASDSLMRVLIKARIQANVGDATVNDIVRALRFVTDLSNITVNDNQDMTFSVSFGAELDQTVRFALLNFDVLPRPQGVRFRGFIESPTFTQFGADLAQMGDSRAQFNEVFL